jgi:hypothetical protein|tara:strand:- start:695 stop:973 length:279 start_codon:yes stop_codon:yes gene_type:complete
MSKEEYLTKIRAESSYPQFRLGITIMTVLAYIGCAIYAFTMIMAMKMDTTVGIIGLVSAALIAFIAIPFWKQMMLMGADMVDSTLDRNSGGR